MRVRAGSHENSEPTISKSITRAQTPFLEATHIIAERVIETDDKYNKENSRGYVLHIQKSIRRGVYMQRTRAAYRHRSLSSTIEKASGAPPLLLADVVSAPVSDVRSKGSPFDRRSRPPSCPQCEIAPVLFLGSNWGQTTAPRDAISRSTTACTFPLGRRSFPASCHKQCGPRLQSRSL